MPEDPERAVREAARAHHDAKARLDALKLMNAPADPQEARVAYEELQMAQAEESRAYYRLLSAKNKFAKP